MSASKSPRAPTAISRAHGSLTAECRRSVSSETPRTRRLTASQYVTAPPRSTSLAPGISAMRAATRPAVQDSAVASVRPIPRARSTSSRAAHSRRPSNVMASMPFAPYMKSPATMQVDRGAVACMTARYTRKMIWRAFQKYWAPETTVRMTAASIDTRQNASRPPTMPATAPPWTERAMKSR